jgi:hypothetical protein
MARALYGQLSKGKKHVNALRALMQTGLSPEKQSSAVELLKLTPLDRLEETVEALKRERPGAEVRAALVERLGCTSLADFDTVKHIYLRHCADPAN